MHVADATAVLNPGYGADKAASHTNVNCLHLPVVGYNPTTTPAFTLPIVSVYIYIYTQHSSRAILFTRA